MKRHGHIYHLDKDEEVRKALQEEAKREQDRKDADKRKEEAMKPRKLFGHST